MAACRTNNPPPPNWASPSVCGDEVSEGTSCEHDGMTCTGADPNTCDRYFCSDGQWTNTSPPCNPPPAQDSATPDATTAAPPPQASGQAAQLVSVDPGGWSGRIQTDSAEHFAVTYSSPPGSACMVGLDLYRPGPRGHGKPMVVASRSPVTVAGRDTELLVTSMFEGKPEEVQAVFVNGAGFVLRVVFRACGRVELDDFLARVAIDRERGNEER